jgi:hypothetical protein
MGIAVQPGRTYYHGSVERRTSAPPCSFFAEAKGLASRYVYEPGAESTYEISKWILPARLSRPALFIDASDHEVREELHAAVARFLPYREKHYEADWAWAFCQARDELFPGYQGLYNTLGRYASLVVFEPDVLMRYGRPVRAPRGRGGVLFKKIRE